MSQTLKSVHRINMIYKGRMPTWSELDRDNDVIDMVKHSPLFDFDSMWNKILVLWTWNINFDMFVRIYYIYGSHTSKNNI